MEQGSEYVLLVYLVCGKLIVYLLIHIEYVQLISYCIVTV